MNAKIHILTIEDDKNMCAYITALLSKDNYRVTNAATGREGLSLTASLCPDLILLDLGLPDIDGFQVLQQLRGWSHVPVIIVSACDEEQQKVHALDLGADDYVTKPFYPPASVPPCGTTGPLPPAKLTGRWSWKSISTDG